MNDQLIDYLRYAIVFRTSKYHLHKICNIAGLPSYDFLGIGIEDKLKEKSLNILGKNLTTESVNEIITNITALNSDTNFRTLSIEYYQDRISEAETFLMKLETIINSYKPVQIEDYISNENLMFYEQNKKFDNDNFRFSTSIYFSVITTLLLSIIPFINDLTVSRIIEFSINSFLLFLFIGIILESSGFFNKVYRFLYQKKFRKYARSKEKVYEYGHSLKFQNQVIEESRHMLGEFNKEFASLLNKVKKAQQNEEEEKSRRLKYEEEKRQQKILADERERKIEILRKKAEYWINLSGYSFEDEVATLFKKSGYFVQPTAYSGDGGADLILVDKFGKKVIVQCKNFSNQASPSIVRDLLGTLHDFQGDYAMLICSGGFTKGTVDFAKRNGIKLLDVYDLIAMVENS